MRDTQSTCGGENAEIEIRRVQWHETIALRHAILWPGRKPEFCRVDGDETAWHFGAFCHEGLVAVASVYPDGDKARLRKFATAHEYQRRGIGTRMLNHILVALREQGIRQFWCDARESAVGFYERFGMKPDGARFYKTGLSYFKMSIQLK